MDKHLKGYLYVVIALLLTSLSFILTTIVVRSVNIISVAFFMFAIGAITSTLILAVSRKLGETKKLMIKYWKPVLVIGILNAVSAILWMSALKLVGPSVTAFLARFGTIFTIIMAVAFLKERFNKLELVGAIIMIAGAFVLSYNGGDFVIKGVIIVLLLSLTFSTWQLMTKIYIKHISPVIMNQIRLMFTFAIIGAYALITQSLEIPKLDMLGLIAISSVAGGVIGFILSYKAMEITNLSKISTIQSLEPFVVMLYAVAILGSIPTGYQLLGGIIIVAGALLLVMVRYRPKFIEKFVE